MGVKGSKIKLENTRERVGEHLFDKQPACAIGGGIGVVRQRCDQIWGEEGLGEVVNVSSVGRSTVF